MGAKTYTMFFATDIDYVSKHIEIYYTPFRVLDTKKNIFVYNLHHSSFKQLFIPNFKSGAKFKFSIDTPAIQNLLEINVYIDRNSLENILNTLLSHYSYKIDELETEKLKYKKFLVSKIRENDLISIKEISKKISTLTKLVKLKNILSLDFDNRQIYFPIMFDFRSRKYSLSDISPTFNKEFRYCLYNGIYPKEYNGLSHVFNAVIQSTFDKYLHLLDKITVLEKAFRKEEKYTII